MNIVNKHSRLISDLENNSSRGFGYKFEDTFDLSELQSLYSLFSENEPRYLEIFIIANFRFRIWKYYVG